MSLKNLGEAIEDLKGEIFNKGYNEGLLEQVAGYWNINPCILELNFIKLSGCPPHRFRADAEAADRIALQYARKLAEKWKNEIWRGTFICGYEFYTKDAEHMVAAAWVSKIHCISVRNLKRCLVNYESIKILPGTKDKHFFSKYKDSLL